MGGFSFGLSAIGFWRSASLNSCGSTRCSKNENQLLIANNCDADRWLNADSVFLSADFRWPESSLESREEAFPEFAVHPCARRLESPLAQASLKRRSATRDSKTRNPPAQ